MVTLSQVQASNALISSQLPSNLVAVFVGATSGIGLYTLQACARHTTNPKVYFVGRSQEAGERIKSECEKICPSGTFTFIASDVSLLKNVDDVCRQIKARETHINLLVLSQGTLVFGTDTSEGLHYAASLIHHSRFRFTMNLLPLIRNTSGLRRVVSIFTGTKEGVFNVNDLQGRTTPFKSARGQAATLVTLGLESLAQRDPTVGFVHGFPGFVKSGIARGTTGFAMGVFKVLSEIAGLWLRMDEAECGERHLFLATSRRYCSAKSELKESTGDVREGEGVELGEGVGGVRGTDGKIGSGVYSVDEFGEAAGEKVETLLKGLREQGTIQKIWDITMDDFTRITGSERLD